MTLRPSGCVLWKPGDPPARPQRCFHTQRKILYILKINNTVWYTVFIYLNFPKCSPRKCLHTCTHAHSGLSWRSHIIFGCNVSLRAFNLEEYFLHVFSGSEGGEIWRGTCLLNNWHFKKYIGQLSCKVSNNLDLPDSGIATVNNLWGPVQNANARCFV